jgi:hypothetical protein
VIAIYAFGVERVICNDRVGPMPSSPAVRFGPTELRNQETWRDRLRPETIGPLLAILVGIGMWGVIVWSIWSFWNWLQG